jgi:hypothetical protein
VTSKERETKRKRVEEEKDTFLSIRENSSSFKDYIERQEKRKYITPHEHFNPKFFITRKKYTETS